MKVKLHNVDHGGCAYYRLRDPARVLSAEGLDIRIDAHIPLERHARGEQQDRPCPVDADVLVFQRPCKKTVVDLLPHYQKMGYAVVIEVDDDMEAIPVDHPGYQHFNHGEDANKRYLAQACRTADLVTVTTPGLAERYGQHGRVAVLPNYIPESLLSMPRESDGHTVGWAGALMFHPGDLGVVGGGLAEALEDWRFLLIGPDADYVQRELGLARIDTTGGLTIAEYHQALGKLDIGIVPLRESLFCESKSALKGLEYAARGVPFIASPTGPYRELALGLLAESRGRSWKARLRELKQDESLRFELAATAHEAASRYTYEKQAWRWAEAWQQALDNRRALVPNRPRLQRESTPEPPHAPPGTPARVAVLMTVYEAAGRLQEALDSVLTQDYVDLELVVLEDGSQDPQVEDILHAVTDPRVTVAHFTPSIPERHATCRYATLINWGAQHTTAPYITYLAGDDAYLPGRLYRMLERLKDGADVVYGAQVLLDETGVMRGTRHTTGPLTDASERVHMGSVMHTRAAFDHVRGWDDSNLLWRTADAHFWRRLTDAGYTFEPVDGDPTDARCFRRDSVDSRVREGLAPWLEAERVAA